MKTIVDTSSLKHLTITDKIAAILAAPSLSLTLTVIHRPPNFRAILTSRINSINKKVVTPTIITVLRTTTMMEDIASPSLKPLRQINTARNLEERIMMLKKRNPWTAFRRKKNKRSFFLCMKTPVGKIKTPRVT
jgi:hypothetical protein